VNGRAAHAGLAVDLFGILIETVQAVEDVTFAGRQTAEKRLCTFDVGMSRGW
jgi:hypothetical protein